MENQESSANTGVESPNTPVDNNIEEHPEGSNTEDQTDNNQSSDIYKVQPKRDRSLKSLALSILKYLPEDILREEPDFSSIKSHDTTQNCEACQECDKPILTEDPPRSLVLNVCGDIVHRTCAGKPDKRGVLECSCGVADDKDPSLVTEVTMDDSISKDTSGQIQRPVCEKCSEDITIDFQKDTAFLSCGHAVHLDCINDLRKRCPTCPSFETMSEVSTLIEQDPSDAQKKRTRESSASTEKSSNKKAKKTGGKKVSSMLKELIEELLTDVPVPTAEENLEEASENEASIFLQLSNRIDNAETKNEDASRGLIHSYFDFGEAIFKRYKELKPEHGKDGSKAIVKKEVRKAIPETKCSDEALRKRTERSKKMYKLFNCIGKERIARIRSIPPSYVLNITKDETKYVMAEILTHKV